MLSNRAANLPFPLLGRRALESPSAWYRILCLDHVHVHVKKQGCPETPFAVRNVNLLKKAKTCR